VTTKLNKACPNWPVTENPQTKHIRKYSLFGKQQLSKLWRCSIDVTAYFTLNKTQTPRKEASLGRLNKTYPNKWTPWLALCIS
jgi:hypothetical protein